MDKKKIVIGADVVPTPSNLPYFESGELAPIFGEELLSFLRDDSFLIVNLETPLADAGDPIKKCGPAFRTPTKAVRGLSSLGVGLVSLANNHIGDRGEEGVLSTMKTLGEAGLSFVGSGKNEKEAAKPFFFSFASKTIGVYSCAEHEFSIASEAKAGANAFDPLFSPDQIAEAKQNCDFLIVLYHGGKEYYRYPSPLLRKVCRRIIDKGADLVICQHSHCIGCRENYAGHEIIYGQGNFVFNKKSDEFWDSSLLVTLDETLSVGYYPIERTETGTRTAEGEKKERILTDFAKRSEEITEEGFVEKAYADFAAHNFETYLAVLHGKRSRMRSGLNHLLSGMPDRLLHRRRYPIRQELMLKNYIECEAHRELLLKGLEKDILSGKEK